jgi:hypothetical protein
VLVIPTVEVLGTSGAGVRFSFELPLHGYLIAPEWTQGAVTRFRAWLGRRVAVIGASAVVGLLIGRGLITLLG